MTDARKDIANESSHSFVEPFRHALNRMLERETLSPDEHQDRVIELLNDRLGIEENVSVSAFAFGAAGIQADHTNYFNGFAILKPMHRGTAVAVRKSESNTIRLVVQDVTDPFEFELESSVDETDPDIVTVIRSLLQSTDLDIEGGLHIALFSTVPMALQSAYLSSMGIATHRAIENILDQQRSETERAKAVNHGLEQVLKYPVSIAYTMAATVDDPEAVLVVDTETLETLPIDVPETTGPGWVLVDTGGPHKPVDRNARYRLSQDILSRIKQRKFKGLSSLRDLEHRDLEAASALLPRRWKAGLKFLVSENRRVQRIGVAIRNQDWQLMGALLVMSHASRRDDWNTSSTLLDFVVDKAERFSIEGVYGATQTEEGSIVLVAGQPFGIPAFLDHIRSNWPANASDGPETFIL